MARQLRLFLEIQAVQYVPPNSALGANPPILQVTMGSEDDSVQEVLSLTVQAATQLKAMLEETLRAQGFL
jgi:hypothetical protein